MVKKYLLDDMITHSTLLMYIVGLAMGMAAGFAMHRSDYCVAGMFRDVFMFRNFTLIRVLLLQVAITMVLFEGLRLAGALPLYPFPLLGFPSWGSIVGGMVFGLGMVLAGGCVVGTLYKMGSGSLVSFTAFLGLIVGSGIYAELHPYWADFFKKTLLTSEYRTLPELTGISPTLMVVMSVALAFVLLSYNRHQVGKSAGVAVRGYLQPWKAAIMLAVIGAFSYVLIGMPLGITTTYAKIAAIAEKLVMPGHVAYTPFYNGLPLNIIHPATGAAMKGGAGPALDAIWIIQFPLIAGIVLGSFLSAMLLGEFALHLQVPGKQLALAFGGGIILALGSRMTPGCNVWHLMGGLPILALQSILFLVGILPGAWLGSVILSRVIMSSSRG